MVLFSPVILSLACATNFVRSRESSLCLSASSHLTFKLFSVSQKCQCNGHGKSVLLVSSLYCLQSFSLPYSMQYTSVMLTGKCLVDLFIISALHINGCQTNLTSLTAWKLLQTRREMVLINAEQSLIQLFLTIPYIRANTVLL